MHSGYVFLYKIFHKPYIWMVESLSALTFLHIILEVREKTIIICEVITCTSQTFEIILLLCAPENAIW